MAAIDTSKTLAEFLDRLSRMTQGELLAQSFVQQGAIHTISTLLNEGCTEAHARQMLHALRQSAEFVRAETARRGTIELFADDQLRKGAVDSQESYGGQTP